MNNSKTQIESKLLIIAHDFLSELQAERALRAVTMQASLDRDLGIDSLGKIELIHRIEAAFSINLPEKAMIEAQTLDDLSTLIAQILSSDQAMPPTPAFSAPLETIRLDVSSETTLVSVLSKYAVHEPHRVHLYLQNERAQETLITYGNLYEKALHIAQGLNEEGIQPGETVAIMLPTSAEFFYAFFGVLLAGATPVPIYPPFRPDKIEEYAKREANILHNAQARLLITFSQAEGLSQLLRSFIPSLQKVTTVPAIQRQKAEYQNLTIPATATALIQYTSGSTGDPKGVMLSHANMLANIRAIGKAIPIQPTDVAVSWLPLYHDMGLMMWLGSLYFGIPLTILSPITFLTRPERWLWAIHYHRATISGGPNFAYELCVKKINPKDIEGLDLSSWKFAFNGAEAINPKTLERFFKKFSDFGFTIDAFAPVYGLAESTVGLTFPMTRRAPFIDKVQREPFEKNNLALPMSLANKATLEFVSCGSPIQEHEIKIVDAQGNPLKDRMVGNLYFRGPSAMKGYFNNPQATQKAFHDGWWDTGDLAYQVDNEIFIVGRKKDLIIKAGRNLYPEEVEDVVNQIPHIRKGCVIAFGLQDPKMGTEKLIVVAETYDVSELIRQQVRQEVIEKMVAALDMPPDEVILVKPRTVPKTSSGKLQRSQCKQFYIEGKLTKRRLPIQFQFIKLAFIGFSKKVNKGLTALFKGLYALYIGLILLVTIPVTWLTVIVLPRSFVVHFVRICVRNFFRIAFCPIKVEGKSNIQSHAPMIYASNHLSYIDALVLLGILPSGIIFIAKKELLDTFIIGTAIKKLGYLTVDRMDFVKSIEDKSVIEAAIEQGHSIVIFPEGTFTHATGLRPFKLGAFTIAANTNTPICPVAIRGTRTILRGESLLPRPGAIHIVFAKPIVPQERDWNEVLRLHTLVRHEIARHCGEAMIDILVAGPEPRNDLS